ncbi:hypothetical protein LCGC14_1867410 [marine sediment metagenome]|uniref:Uncharacterized protein n=1 Tax=marine sediment metagenome TaxID=412755 RepID=A0A0F9G606_9ZZZZ
MAEVTQYKSPKISSAQRQVLQELDKHYPKLYLFNGFTNRFDSDWEGLARKYKYHHTISYKTSARLEKLGLLEIVVEGMRQKYCITNLGRRILKQP